MLIVNALNDGIDNLVEIKKKTLSESSLWFNI
jgi:hypothetical protein